MVLVTKVEHVSECHCCDTPLHDGDNYYVIPSNNGVLVLCEDCINEYCFTKTTNPKPAV